MADYKTEDLLVRPNRGEGEKTETDMRIIARVAMLGGDFGIMQGKIAPRKLLPPHTHENEDQAVFVIAGTAEFEVGGKDGLHFSAGPGEYVLKPRGVSHAFWNPSETETVHYIELSGRDGFEKFVDNRAKGLLRWQVEAKRKQGLTTHYEQIPRLLRENKLTGFAAATYGGEEG